MQHQSAEHRSCEAQSSRDGASRNRPRLTSDTSRSSMAGRRDLAESLRSYRIRVPNQSSIQCHSERRDLALRSLQSRRRFVIDVSTRSRGAVDRARRFRCTGWEIERLRISASEVWQESAALRGPHGIRGRSQNQNQGPGSKICWCSCMQTRETLTSASGVCRRFVDVTERYFHAELQRHVLLVRDR
jgi:hypothetical protein